MKRVFSFPTFTEPGERIELLIIINYRTALEALLVLASLESLRLRAGAAIKL